MSALQQVLGRRAGSWIRILSPVNVSAYHTKNSSSKLGPHCSILFCPLESRFLRTNNASMDLLKVFHSTAKDDQDKSSETEKKEEDSSSEVKELKATIEELTCTKNELQEKSDELMDKYRRSIAENDNMRKRLTKQIEEAKIFGIQSFGKDLLEVADVLSKAVEMGTEGQTLENMHQGLVMTQAQLSQVFKRHGLEPVSPEMGEKFDPNKHEALFQVPVPDKEPNVVVDVQKVGYSLRGRTIRPALVGVSKKK